MVVEGAHLVQNFCRLVEADLSENVRYAGTRSQENTHVLCPLCRTAAVPSRTGGIAGMRVWWEDELEFPGLEFSSLSAILRAKIGEAALFGCRVTFETLEDGAALPSVAEIEYSFPAPDSELDWWLS